MPSIIGNNMSNEKNDTPPTTKNVFSYSPSNRTVRLGTDTSFKTYIEIPPNVKLTVRNTLVKGIGYLITEGQYAGYYINQGDTKVNPTVYPDPPKKEETKKNPGEDTQTSAPSEKPAKNDETNYAYEAYLRTHPNATESDKAKAKATIDAEAKKYKPVISEAYAEKRNELESTPVFFAQNVNKGYSEAIDAFTNAFGSPFLFTNDTDPCYFHKDNESDYSAKISVGRTMLSTLYSTPAVFSICPGKVEYLPNVFAKKNLFEEITKRFASSDITTDFDPVGTSWKDKEDGGSFAKQLYAFTPDYNDYINRLNVMARVSALFMGIGDREVPWKKGVKYRNADYSYYTTGKRNERSGGGGKGLKDFLWQLDTGDIDNTNLNYIHFFMTADGSVVDQNFSTETGGIDLLDGLQGTDAQKKVREISFLFNGAMSESDAWNSAKEDLAALAENVGSSSEKLGSLIHMARGWAQGGRMIIPDMIDNVIYESSVTCRLNFRSLYGDPESIFLNVNLPCLALLCFVLPKQLAENMYGYPYVCRCFQRGFFTSDLCIISNLNFRRGGDSETSWSESGVATEVEATFTITPLYAALAGGNGRNPYLFMTNTALIEYLGNMCGLDLKVDQIDLKLQLIKNLFVENFYQDIPDVIGRKTHDFLRGKLDKLFSFN